jgi:hypothetical protein
MDSDERMFELLKAQPDFECFVLPSHWYKKFNIEPVKAEDPASFIKSNYTQICSAKPKDLPPIIIDEPQDNGRTWKVFPEEKVDVKVVTRPFVQTTKSFPAVLPALQEMADANT